MTATEKSGWGLGTWNTRADFAAGLWVLNRRRARAAVLYYEELEPDTITTLGIGSWVEG